MNVNLFKSTHNIKRNRKIHNKNIANVHCLMFIAFYHYIQKGNGLKYVNCVRYAVSYYLSRFKFNVKLPFFKYTKYQKKDKYKKIDGREEEETKKCRTNEKEISAQYTHRWC